MSEIFIFGYGSFQNFNSIEKTVLSIKYNEVDIEFLKKNICKNCITIFNEAFEYDKYIRIVRVNNIKRGWFFNVNNENKITKPWIALGVYQSEGFTCNGTLFPVTEEQLSNIDLRECGYARKILDKNNIELIKGLEMPDNAIIYYYTLEESEVREPTDIYPILQSYVDLCMTGCILIDQMLENKNYEYTNEFVKTTYNWNEYKYWINDRVYPRRPTIYIQFANIIDKILSKTILN